MACGKRHGGAILWTESTPTFDDCMNSCGKVLVSIADGLWREERLLMGN